MDLDRWEGTPDEGQHGEPARVVRILCLEYNRICLALTFRLAYKALIRPISISPLLVFLTVIDLK